jgi:hypothetical protein
MLRLQGFDKWQILVVQLIGLRFRLCGACRCQDHRRE